MATIDKLLVLACDPNEGQWSIVLQTDNPDEAIEFWENQPKDNSRRITINTASYITFPIE